MKKITVVFLALITLMVIGGNSIASDFSDEQICIAAIASIMGKNPEIIQIDKVKGGIIYLSYVRQDDGKQWKYRCKIDGDRVIWASDTGRWRTDKYDSVITYSVDGNTLTINETYSDGSGSSKEYELN